MARIILDCHLRYTKYNRESPPKSVLAQLLKNTRLVDDPVLALEIDVCNAADNVYGPVVDSIKRSLGHEYEFMLTRKLEEADIAFEDESVLRTKGYDKTPDFMLPVPIAIEGRVINWIESKASFGDPESHAEYLDSQFWSYLNRFGSGLVIYWFGFVDELDCHQDKGIVLLDHFPSHFVSLPHSTPLLRQQEERQTVSEKGEICVLPTNGKQGSSINEERTDRMFSTEYDKEPEQESEYLPLIRQVENISVEP